MKTVPSIMLMYVLCLCICMGCKDPDRQDEGTGTPTNQDTFKDPDKSEGIEAYESEDRVIWQKPDLVIDQLGEVEGKVVADLGAGTGYFSRRIAYKGASVIAIDIDTLAIQWMETQKARFPAELQERLVIRQADENDPKLRPNEVDIILLVNTYSYINDRVSYFNKLKPAFRRGGYMVIIDFKKQETPFGPPLEERLDISEVEKELTDAGYEILRSDEESLEYQYIIKARRV